MPSSNSRVLGCRSGSVSAAAVLLAAYAVSAMFGCGSSDSQGSPSGLSGASNSTAGAAGSASPGGAPAAAGAGATAGLPSASGGATAGSASSAGGAGGAGGAAAAGASAAGAANGGSVALGGASAAGGAVGGSLGMGGAGLAGSAGKAPGTAAANAATVDPSKEYQTMDGFGFADVWQSKGNSTAAMVTLLFDPVNGIGASLLRIGIDGTSGKPNIMGDAAFVDGPAVVKYGGKVWAAPWSPPAGDKDNGNVNNGGHLQTSAYDSWASVLAAFPAYYKQQSGVDLYAISAQNEPDFVASYQSCIFNSAQMNNFIKVLQPKLAALNPPVKVLAAEPDAYNNLWGGDNYGNAILNDATVSPLVSIIATHDYDNASSTSTTRPAPPSGANTTHHLWQTEITYNATGAGITPGLDIARGIYAAVTSGGVNGWLYWWTQSLMDGGTASNPPKRVYGLGNFSKFVRPGYVRIGVTGQPSGLQVATFKNPADNTVVIVVLNSGSSAASLPVFVAGSSWPAKMTPYVTDASNNLAAQGPITVTAANFTATVGAKSVTTFVGKP